jgi:hypothetical protein
MTAAPWRYQNTTGGRPAPYLPSPAPATTFPRRPGRDRRLPPPRASASVGLLPGPGPAGCSAPRQSCAARTRQGSDAVRHRLDGQPNRRGRPRLDLVGRRFGRLVVLAPAEARGPHGQPLWRCRCDCGREAKVATGALRSGNKTFCDCACAFRPSQQRAAARRMRRQGQTLVAIAAALGVSYQRVHQLLVGSREAEVARFCLLAGPYVAPRLREGDTAYCLLRRCRVVITGRTNALIPWPRCRALDTRGGGSGLLLDEELARDVRHESSLAIQHWWGSTTPSSGAGARRWAWDGPATRARAGSTRRRPRPGRPGSPVERSYRPTRSNNAGGSTAS